MRFRTRAIYCIVEVQHDDTEEFRTIIQQKFQEVQHDDTEEFRTIIQQKFQEVQHDDTEEFRTIIQQKFQDMEDAGVLMAMRKKEMCSKQNGFFGCIDPNCTGSLPPITSPENIRSVLRPLQKIKLTKLKEVIQAFRVRSEKKKYVFVTGASSNHFNESQPLIQSLHEKVLPYISNYSFYYYDLGLDELQRQLIRNVSGAELRSFPFDNLPVHMTNLHCYTWKPLIALAHLPHSEFLIWMDSSIRFTQQIHLHIHKASWTGLYLHTNTLPMAQHTVLSMFSYFGDKPCQFSTYEEIETGLFVFHNEPFISRLFVEPWSACALDPNCMCPPHSQFMLRCIPGARQYGACHRYDQSTLGYLAIKLFGVNYPSIFIKEHFHSDGRGHISTYLYDLQRNKRKPFL